MNFFEAICERIRRYDDTHNFTCDICAREVFAGERVCAQCKKTLPYNNGHICPLCGRKVLEEGICLECKQKPPKVKARSVFLHEGEAARLVVRFKKGKKYLYRAAAELALPLFEREFSDTDAIIFVPMTEKARKKRGYNQSRLFAEELARRAEKPVIDAVSKRRETNAQKFLGREEREHNLEGCFHADKRAVFKDKTICIVDDTFTTGATVNELADVVLRAGAKKVYALTLTSVQNKTPFGKPPKK